MYIKKKRYVVLIAAAIALLSPSVHAASNITIYVSPAVSSAAADLVSDFINVTNDIGATGRGYNVSLKICPTLMHMRLSLLAPAPICICRRVPPCRSISLRKVCHSMVSSLNLPRIRW